MKSAATLFLIAFASGSSLGQCNGWFPAPWSPVRPDPTGSRYLERSYLLDLATAGPASVVVLNIGAGNHSGDPYRSGPDAYVDRGGGWERFGTFGPVGGESNFRIDQACMYRGQVIIAGIFSGVDGVTAWNIGAWDGASWHPLGEGLPSAVKAIATYGDELFASGGFGIRRWNGTTWTDASTLLHANGSTSQVSAPMFREYLGDLVAPFWQVSVMKWRTDHWEALFESDSASSNGVHSFEVIGNRMMFGCHFSTGYPGPTLAMYDGAYHSMCVLCWPIGTGDGSVNPPLDINGDGELDFLANVSMSQYTCSSCTHNASESVMLLGPDQASAPSTFPPYPQGGGNLNYCSINRPGDILSGGYQFRSGYPLFNFGPRNLSITQPRHDAVFSSLVTNTPPDVNYSWTRNGIALQDGPTPHGSVISGSHTARLTIHLPTSDDAGAYSLTVENPGCQTASSPAAILSVCLADFNGDSGVDFFDYLDFVAALSDNLPAADFNGDGVIDFFDYLDFVQAFSAGC